MKRSMRRLAVFTPEDVLSHADPKAPRKDYPDLEGREWSVKMCSQRYSTFQRSLSCACCGITGSVMILEWQLRGDGSEPKVQQPHFNLYAVTPDGLILITKDHILPKSQGGQDILSNYQTMCELCNTLKGADQIDVETIRARRKQYDEQPRKKKKNYGSNKPPEELISCLTDEHKAVFWSNIQRTHEGCWLWVGPVPSRGFPRFTIVSRNGLCSVSSRQRGGRRGKKGLFAYKIAYCLAVGEPPQNRAWPMCRNRLCCNPVHMGIKLDRMAS